MGWRKKQRGSASTLAPSPVPAEPSRSTFRQLEVISSGRHVMHRQQGAFQAADAWGGEAAGKHRVGSFSAGFGVGLSLGLALGLQRRLTLPKPHAGNALSPARQLLSRGEPVSVSVDTETWVPVFDALLDTGNEAHTVLSATLARRLNLQPIEHSKPFIMKGTNGWSSAYPRCQFRLRIAGFETGWIEGAIGGSTSILLGRDVLLPLAKAGYTVRMV